MDQPTKIHTGISPITAIVINNILTFCVCIQTKSNKCLQTNISSGTRKCIALTKWNATELHRFFCVPLEGAYRSRFTGMQINSKHTRPPRQLKINWWHVIWLPNWPHFKWIFPMGNNVKWIDRLKAQTVININVNELGFFALSSTIIPMQFDAINAVGGGLVAEKTLWKQEK